VAAFDSSATSSQSATKRGESCRLAPPASAPSRAGRCAPHPAKDLETSRRTGTLTNKCNLYFDFVRVCFTTLVTSVIVEALFSQYDAMKGKGNKSRSSLTDEHTLEALLTREAEVPTCCKHY
jgi:hypothetical protein